MDDQEERAVIDPTYDPRVVGQLTRYHSWPRIRQQSNGEHSWQIARILITVWPDCPRKMVVHCITHDMGEMAGDVQYPFKKRVPGLKAKMDIAERGVRDEMCMRWGMSSDHMTVKLSDYEHRVFKCLEYIEMWEWGLHEANLGNRYGETVAMRCLLEASALRDGLEPTPGYADIRPAIKRYCDKRINHETGEK